MQQTISRVAWVVGIVTIVLAALRFIWNLYDASRIGITDLSGRDWMFLITDMTGLAVTGLFAMGFAAMLDRFRTKMASENLLVFALAIVLLDALGTLLFWILGWSDEFSTQVFLNTLATTFERAAFALAVICALAIGLSWMGERRTTQAAT